MAFQENNNESRTKNIYSIARNGELSIFSYHFEDKFISLLNQLIDQQNNFLNSHGGCKELGAQ